MKNCEICKNDFVPNSDRENLACVCSDSCRAIWYRRRTMRRNIENGNYDNLKVKQIKELGYEVTVKKIEDDKN